jgi:phosphohistidine swiveling domain-containing protein
VYCISLAPGLDPAQVGNKAANLGQALSLGLQVPAAFAITRDALALFLGENGLVDRVQAYLDHAGASTRAAQKQAYEELCALVRAASVPQAIEQEVRARVEALLLSAPAGLAARSSATHEDSEQASFAGVYHSSLCLSSVEQVWEAVRDCWCSSWSPQAVAYALKMGVELQPGQMAVIVQEVVPAGSAGVVFTADPLTGNPWRFVLNAVFGLAQDLVAGSAPADRFVLEWDTGRILERRVAAKKRAVAASRSGVRMVDLPEERWRAASLPGEMARQIGQLALDLDQALGRRVDVEWAVAGANIYVLQVRPITALPPFFPHQLDGPDAECTWTPSDPVWYHTVEPGCRVVAPFFKHRWASELWLRHQPAAEKALPRPVWQERDFNGYRYATTWMWGGPWRDLERTERWLDETEARLRQDWLDSTRELLQACERVAEAQREARCAADLIPLLLSFQELEADFQAAVWAAPQSLGWICEGLLQHLIQDAAPGFPVELLLQGLPCYSLERTISAQDLGRSMGEEARSVFRSEPLSRVIASLSARHRGCAFLQAYERLCWRFGLRPPGWPEEWARWTYAPSGEWGQDPMQTLVAIRGSALGQGQDARAVLATREKERTAAEADLRARVAQRDPSLLGRLDKIIGWTQFWVPVLDNRKWHLVARIRLADLMHQVGTMLVREGVLERPNDLLLFTREDLGRLAERDEGQVRREMVRARKRAYERDRRLTPLAYLGAPPSPAAGQTSGEGEPATGAHPAHRPGRVLCGQGYAPGRVTGSARKTLNLDDARFLDSLDDGQIIVCAGTQTWDTDWLSLLMVAGGLVTVQGAQLHHATQIAHECGVPFVNLPEDNLGSIPDHAQIAIDGVAGTVTLLEPG